MKTSVLGAPVTINFDNVGDSVSREEGDATGVKYCGPR